MKVFTCLVTLVAIAFVTISSINARVLVQKTLMGETCPGGIPGNAYNVKSGDYCYKIATDHGISVDQLQAANPNMDCNNLKPGGSLCLPLSCSSDNIYIIKSGDYCQAIAINHGISLDNLLATNPGLDCNLLQIDQNICLPPPCSGHYYTVVSGDFCQKIAAENGVTLSALEAANLNVDCNNLPVGEIMCIPPNAILSPPPSPLSPPIPLASVVAFWRWTWSVSTSNPTNTNLGIAFSGYADPSKALADSAKVKDSLPGLKFISLGGGNENGHWSQSVLSSVKDSIKAGSFSGYQGISFDVEEGDTGLQQAFQEAFETAQAAGLKVIVTVSHSSPYGVADGPALMKSFFSSASIDYLSPQLYTSGMETENDYTQSAGVQWSDYVGAKALFLPSIVDVSMYSSAVQYFKSLGIATAGFAQWKQV